MVTPLRIRTDSLSSIRSDRSIFETMEHGSNDAAAGFASLLETGLNSDLTVHCATKAYRVHRAVLSARSAFFGGACVGPWKESQDGLIDLHDDDPEAVEHMIRFFYHLDYMNKAPLSRRSSRKSNRPTSPVSPPMSPSVRRTKKLDLSMIADPLLACATSSQISEEEDDRTPTKPKSLPTPPVEDEDKHFDLNVVDRQDSAVDMEDGFDPFDISDLEIPEQEANLLEPQLTIHAKVYGLADKYGIQGLKDLAKAKYAAQLRIHWNSTEFADSLMEIYDSTVDSDRGLRNVAVQMFRAHPQLENKHDVEDAIKTTPGLAWDLFRMAKGKPLR